MKLETKTINMEVYNRTLVSSMTAQRIPVLSIAWWRLSRVSWWYSWDPCEKLNRATFIPALRSFSTIGTDLEAGPRVQTIFVFGLCSIIAIASEEEIDTESRIVDDFVERERWREIYGERSGLENKENTEKRIWERRRDFMKSEESSSRFFWLFEVKKVRNEKLKVIGLDLVNKRSIWLVHTGLIFFQ